MTLFCWYGMLPLKHLMLCTRVMWDVVPVNLMPCGISFPFVLCHAYVVWDVVPVHFMPWLCGVACRPSKFDAMPMWYGMSSLSILCHDYIVWDVVSGHLIAYKCSVGCSLWPFYVMWDVFLWDVLNNPTPCLFGVGCHPCTSHLMYVCYGIF